MIQKEADSVFTLLPSKKQPELATMKTYTYIAEVHFNKPISETGVKLDNSKEYSIPTCLGQWVKRTRELNRDLIVLPYREESGANPITHEDQIPLDDCEAISHYFHNHRIENNGILKGMIKFSISIPWMQLKDPRSSYFKWLSQNRVYLCHTSFDADTVVLLGFLYGIPPDAARLLDVTNELMERLRLRDAIKFQVTPRSLTAVHSPLTGNKFGFKALAIETDAKMAGELREALFGLGDPKVQKHTWPVTGNSLFVPMYKTASWTTESISAMAKLHVKMVSNLEQIFVENVHAIDDTITFREPGGTETRRTLREAIQASTTKEGDEYVVHSVHTTNREGVIRILVTNKHALHAKEFFGNLQAHLRATLSGEDLYRITQGKQIQIVGRIAESNESKIYASYAAALLRENPQDGIAVEHELEISSPQRKKSRMEISYSNMAKRALEPARRRNPAANPGDDYSTEPEGQSGEELEDSWELKIQASFQKLFGDQPPLRAEEVEQRMQEVVNKQAAESERRLDGKFANLTSELRTHMDRESEKSKRLIQLMFEKQNQLFLNLTSQIQENLLKLDENIKVVALQSSTPLPHMETPRIDVRKTSPVARRGEYGTTSAGDAPT